MKDADGEWLESGTYNVELLYSSGLSTVLEATVQTPVSIRMPWFTPWNPPNGWVTTDLLFTWSTSTTPRPQALMCPTNPFVCWKYKLAPFPPWC